MRKNQLSRGAFTLVEILVATALGLVILTLLLQLLLNNAKLWEGSRNRVEAFREARAFQESFQRDLNAMAIIPEAGSLPVLLCSKAPGAQNTDTDLDSIFFLRRGTAESTEDLCLVGYFTRWDAARKTYVMERAQVQGTKVIDRFLDIAALPKPMAGPDMVKKLFNMDDGIEEDVDYGRLGAYIFNVKIRVNEETSYSDKPYCLSDINGVVSPQATYPGLPKIVTLAFTTISPRATKVLEQQSITKADWVPDSSTGTFTNPIIQRYHQNFTTKVAIQ